MIGGATASGKSTLAKFLFEAIFSQYTDCISKDAIKQGGVSYEAHEILEHAKSYKRIMFIHETDLNEININLVKTLTGNDTFQQEKCTMILNI